MNEQPYRVLVVEDDEFIRLVVCAALDDEGFDVKSASNGREALAVLEEWRPDLIVLDLRMPAMDGPTFRAHQRKIGEIADIPVVILSGDGELQTAREALEAAAALPKPCDLDVLIKTVGRLTRSQPTATAR